jgi:Ca2+-binding RTX toxin-like protein
MRQPPDSPAVALHLAGVAEATASADAPFGAIYGVIAYGEQQRNSVLGIEITPTGVLRVVSNTAAEVSWGIAVAHEPALTVLIQGRLEVSSPANAVGISGGLDGRTEITNSGVILVTSTAQEAGGVAFDGPGLLLNSGLIEVHAQKGGSGAFLGQWGPARFENSGTIRVSDHTDAVDSAAVAWAQRSGGGGSWTNTGVLEGDYALKVYGTAQDTGMETFRNDGTMTGRVEMGDGATRLVNTNTIRGAVTLSGGDDIYDGGDGVASGQVSGGVFGDDGNDTLNGGDLGDTLNGGAGDDRVTGGGGLNYLRGDAGNDSLVGGSGFDDLNGNAGDDTCVSGGGDDWVVGGKDNDSLVGSAGQNIVYGNLGADTCDGGGGNDILRGGQDDDVIQGGAGDDYVSGDRGADTVSGGPGADFFHAFGDAGLDRVTDFSQAQGDRILLDPGTQYTVAQSGADTVVTMTGGAQLVLVGVQMSTLTAGWIFGA